MGYFLLGFYFFISYQNLLIYNQGPGLALTNTDCTDNFPKDFSVIIVKIWLAQLVEHLTLLDLGVVSSSPMLGVELT